MKRVIIESPYAGDVEGNVRYAKLCVRDSLKRGEAPYASHLFFTQEGLLDDSGPAQRKLGIEAGLAWGDSAALVAIYVDRGVSGGMIMGITHHVSDMRGVIGWPTLHLRSLWSPLEVSVDYMGLVEKDRQAYVLDQAEAYSKMVALVRAAT